MTGMRPFGHFGDAEPISHQHHVVGGHQESVLWRPSEAARRRSVWSLNMTAACAAAAPDLPNDRFGHGDLEVAWQRISGWSARGVFSSCNPDGTVFLISLALVKRLG
jgi:hypothetical protein